MADNYFEKGLTSIPFLILFILIFYEFFGEQYTFYLLFLILLTVILFKWNDLEKILKGGV
jgi:hypothetical protein